MVKTNTDKKSGSNADEATKKNPSGTAEMKKKPQANTVRKNEATKAGGKIGAEKKIDGAKKTKAGIKTARANVGKKPNRPAKTVERISDVRKPRADGKATRNLGELKNAKPEQKRIADAKMAEGSEKPEVEIETKVEPGAVTARATRRAMPVALRMMITFLFLAAFAGIFTWYILLQQNLGDAEATLKFIQEKPILGAYSYTIILLVLCVVAAATWRPVLTIGLGFIFCSVLMYINAQKVAYRDAPLLPEDFLMTEQAGTIMQFVDQGSITRLVAGVILVLIGAFVADYRLRRIFGRETRGKAWWEKHNVLPRTLWTLVALAGLMMFARPVLHYDDKSEEGDKSWIEGMGFSYWNQKSDFAHNGFILAFLYNLGRFQEPEPDEYNEEAMRAITKKYKNATEKSNAPELAKQVDNLIVVLDESFIDPEILGETYAHDGGDIVPELHKIFEKYPSGYMYSPIYGGGTANAEFEVLTGLSNYWAQTIPYVTSLTKLGNIPGLIGNAKAGGMTGTAIHPFDKTMYKRDAVYQRMGMEGEFFIDREKMGSTETDWWVTGFVNDKATYSEALRVLSDGEKKHMIMIATMQNHMPYDPVLGAATEFQLQNNVKDAEYFEGYSYILHNSDKHLGEFVKELDKVKERTVMVWFGDHAPSVLTDYVESENPELIDKAHLTPYFIYANFDLKELYTEKEVAQMNAKAGFSFETDGVNLPVVTPNCLSGMLYDLLGAKKTPLIELTSRVCKESPILAPSYSQNDKVKQTELLKEYRFVNYDILSGRGWWLEM